MLLMSLVLVLSGTPEPHWRSLIIGLRLLRPFFGPCCKQTAKVVTEEVTPVMLQGTALCIAQVCLDALCAAVASLGGRLCCAEHNSAGDGNRKAEATAAVLSTGCLRS